MEEIKLYIISDEENSEDNINDVNNSKKISQTEYDEIKDEFKLWIQTIIIYMNSCNYRKALQEIESKKGRFNILDTYTLWKYKILKIKAIFKIIKIKFKKYKTEIKKENNQKITSIKFWFNQVFIVLTELIKDFIPKKNNEIDLNAFKTLKPIQCIIESYIELIYLLIQFYHQRQEGVPQILAYLSVLNLFMPYISLITNYKTINIVQNLLLFKSKLFFENKNYLLSIEQQKHVVKLCLKFFTYITDLDSKINVESSSRNTLTKEVYKNFVNYIIAFYLRGVTCEHLNDMQKATQAYTQCRLTYMKYLIEENEKFGMFMNKIDNDSRLFLDITNDIKDIIKKRKRNAIIRKKNNRKNRYSLLLMRNNEYHGYYNLENSLKSGYDNIHYKKIMRPKIVLKGIRNTFRVAYLEKYLNHIGKNLYIEEQNLNNNIINKYTKSKYILSTITMIDNLLSKDFNGVLMKMNNIEITKPKEEIQALIEKNILTKRVKMFNINLKNKKRQKSALNIYRSQRFGERDKKEYNGCKTTMIKNSINNYNLSNFNNKNKNNLINNIDKKFSSTIPSDRNYNLYNIDTYKKKNTLNLSQKMPDSYISKNRILKNIAIKEANIRIKSAIDRVNTKKNRYLSSYGQVVKYPINKEEFSKNQLRKKNYLYKYLDKELTFQKKLLNSKRNEVKDLDEIDYYNHRKVYEFAEREFDMIFNIAKSKYSDKYISNLITMKQMKINNENSKKNEISNKNNDSALLKIKKEMITAKYNLRRKRGGSELNLKKMIYQKNEDDMKKLSAECLDLSFKRKKIENQRRNLILRPSKSSTRKDIQSHTRII